MTCELTMQITFSCGFLVKPAKTAQFTLVPIPRKDGVMLLNISKPTVDGLAERLRVAARSGVSANDLHSQKVSFIVSSISDEKTKVTSQQVEAELQKLHGKSR